MKTKSLLHCASLGLAAITMLCLTTQSSLAATWDASADFSLASNPNGAWTYQYLTGLAPGEYGDFTFADNNRDGLAGLLSWTQATGSIPGVFKNTSATNTYYGWEPGALGMYPSATGNHSVVTWTAPSSGDYSLASSFNWLGTSGNGVVASVAKNAFTGLVQLGAQQIGGNSPSTYSYNDTLTLSAGDTISWALNANGANDVEDFTRLNAVVTSVPEPSTYAFLCIGAIGMFFVHRRNKARVNL